MNSLIVLNDIVNQKGELLEKLRKFTNKLYEKGRRMRNDILGGWYVEAKSLNKSEYKELKSIYDQIISSDDLIEPIIIYIDKQNEIYEIIMRKNELITLSINILISMYIPGSKNYNNFTEEQLNRNNLHIKALNPIVEAKITSMLKPQDKKSQQNYYSSHKSNSSYQLQLINDIVNQKGELLEKLRKFTNKLYEKGRRMRNDILGGWYVEAKSLNKSEYKELKSIYDQIISSDDLIEPIIIYIDKQNEIYEIIMRKNELITLSINILISMYIPGSKNYNNFTEEQLTHNDIHINILNPIVEVKMTSMLQPQDKKSRQNYYSSHKSNSSHQLPLSSNDIHIKTSNPIVEAKMTSVSNPQDKKKSQSKYSHSYNSKSSHSILLTNFVTNDNNTELLLINAIGDGDCFINAIFDYGLYTGNLLHIYDRLIHFELLIENLPKYENSIKKAKSLFGSPKLDKLTSKEYAKILDNKLLKESDSDTKGFKKRYKIPEQQLLTCFHHPFPEDRERLSKEYEIERKKFIKFMKYIQVLYVYTYGNNIISKKLTNVFSIAKKADILDYFDFDINFIEYIKKKYYDRKSDLKEPIHIPTFLDDYMNFYARTDGYYSAGDQILIFKKIFFKKLKLRNSEDSIPCFWLNYEFQENIRLSSKKIKFMKILKESVEVDNNKKFISIIRDGEHFKLFVYRDQTIIY